MLSWIIQITIISFIFIFLIDHLIKFFTNTLTVPKIKDLVNNPNKKYESIYEILSHSKDIRENNNNNNNSSTDIFSLPLNISSDYNSKEDMKNELKNFLKNQLTVDDDISENKKKEILDPEYFQFK
jgi:hypothetical protein